jgi:hypothetical protein
MAFGDDLAGTQSQTRQDQAPSGPQGVDVNALSDKWNEWIDKPTNRAALMQFGVAMLQPVGMGESQISHAANALGYAGQAAANVEGQRLAREKSSSEQELREARALQAASMAGRSEDRSNVARERLEETRRYHGALEDQRATKGALEARRAYDAYVDKTQKANANADLMGRPTSPILSFEDYRAASGLSVTPPNPDAQMTLPPGQKPAGPRPAGPTLKSADLAAHPTYSVAIQDIKNALASSDPRQQARARATIDQLRGVVSDPENLNLIFGVQ